MNANRFAHIPCKFDGCPFRTYENHSCGRTAALVEELEKEAGLFVKLYQILIFV